ncbi:MAG: pyridoxal phosphate-dependent aminotransferase [bacterium]
MQLANRISKIQDSPTLAISARAKKMQEAGEDIINFGVGQPDFDTPDNIKSSAVKAIEEGFTKYTPASGIPALREAAAQRFFLDQGVKYDASEAIICCGAKHALYNLMMVLLNPGDEVLIPAPYWVTYPEQVKAADAEPVIVPTTENSGFKVSPEILDKYISPKTKLLILNTPSNPTGAIYKREDLEEIGKFALAHDLVIVSDECYDKLIYDGQTHVSIASLGEEIKTNTIVINAVSKAYSMTGWRIGYALGDKTVISAMGKLQSQTTSNPASISQKAALEALAGSQEEIGKRLIEFDRRRNYLYERLNGIPGMTCFRSQGAFYLFPDVSGFLGREMNGKLITNSAELATYLLERAKVATVPGSAFGAEGYLRLSYATSLEKIEKALDRIEQALKMN